MGFDSPEDLIKLEGYYNNMMRVVFIIIGMAVISACLGVDEVIKIPKEQLNHTSDSVVKEPEEPANLKQARSFMIEHHIKGRGITDEGVLMAMGKIKRQEFVSSTLRDSAYSDNPLPIGEGQTISQPYVVALMTEALNLRGGEKVLEIGTGSGYQATVLAEIGVDVYTIEIREGLARNANELFQRLGYTNIKTRNADGYYGWEEHAPFDAIMVTAAVNHIPPPLIAQLKDGGRLILPLGDTTYYQTLTLVEKSDGEVSARHITGVRFVPLVGEAQKL